MEYELKYEELKQEYLEAIKTLEVAQEKGSVTEDEFKRIADMHASLFGHNNNKQKIKYIDQIKQENLKLKSVSFFLLIYFTFYRILLSNHI